MALGRGLSSLIPSYDKEKIVEKDGQKIFVDTGESVLRVPLNKIKPNPNQPRKNFSHLEMEELINSIKEYGIIQPLILTKTGDYEYEIIAGERRWRAAKVAELNTVPALIRSVTENEKLEISLLENIQRKDLNPMEKAKAYQRLINEFNLTQEQVSKRIGKARASIANTLRLLSLPQIIQQAIEEEKITEGHARALLSADSEEKQKSILKRILGLGLTVREAEQHIKGKRIRKTIELSSNFLKQEKILAEVLGTKVKIFAGGGTVIGKQNKKIKVVIEFYQEEEIDNLIKKLINHKE